MTKHSSKSGSEIAPLAITVGEPAGIGPELVLMLAMRHRRVPWIAIGDRRLLAERAAAIGLDVVVTGWCPGQSTPIVCEAGQLAVLDVPNAVLSSAGRLDVRNAQSVLDMLQRAVEGCIAGDFAGMVTAPVQKSIINDAGMAFTGHTEFLQQQSGVEDVVMMLATRTLRVALATTHLPLRDVADAITPELLTRRLLILHRDLVERFAITQPRILVSGLNPHAGERGHLGREEIEVINPVLDALRGQGMQLIGPLPADTLFTPRVLATGDAVMTMYHDQGLPVLKAAGFGEAVNITLGLPYVRTSVDHGTALDLAGLGTADPGSLQAAIDLATDLVA